MEMTYLNELFTKKQLFNVTNGDFSFIKSIMDKYNIDGLTVFDGVNNLYRYLKNEYRNEYYYKNLLLNKLIVSRHKLGSTKVMTELNIGNSVADFVTLNGHICVYEIKSEFDNLKRLKNQISDYFTISPYVYVVTCRQHLNECLAALSNSKAGLILIDEKSHLVEIKEAECNYEEISKKNLFLLLRKDEYNFIINKYYKKLPVCSDFDYYEKCFNLFEKIDVISLYNEVLRLLKNRIFIDCDAVKKTPYSIRGWCYFNDLFISSEILYRKVRC